MDPCRVGREDRVPNMHTYYDPCILTTAASLTFTHFIKADFLETFNLSLIQNITYLIVKCQSWSFIR